jgi:hypothetical protein
VTSRYAIIAGGPPSSVSGLTEYMQHGDLAPEQAKLAAYYQHGGEPEHSDFEPCECQWRIFRKLNRDSTKINFKESVKITVRRY